MRKYERREMKRIENFLVKFSCDICGKEGDCFYEQWTNKNYRVEETTVSYKTGSSYPDGSGAYKIYSFDICNECFKKHIIDHFKTVYGIDPNIKEEDF